MSLNCRICKSSVKSRQQPNNCMICKAKFHRTCLPKVDNATYYQTKNAYKCDSCIIKPRNPNLMQKCNVCKCKLFNNAICFLCNFPPPEIHELFFRNDDDFVHYIQFLFK